MGRLEKIRKGDRAEYLSNFFLSHIGFTTPVPRQEDYGIDFFCSTCKSVDDEIFFDIPFVIQIKSSFTDIKYGKKKKNGWKKEEIETLFNLKAPLFIGIIDLEDNKFNLYPTSQVWFVQRQYKNCSQIILKPKKSIGRCSNHKPVIRDIPSWGARGGDGKKYIIDIGKPLIAIEISELGNNDKLKNIRAILRKVIRVERQNLIYKDFDLPFFKWIYEYETNNMDITFGWMHYDEETEISIPDKIIANSAQYLISLALSFKLHHKHEEFEALKKIIKLVPDQDQYQELKEKHPGLFE